MFSSFFVSTALIFAAELGDKSQLVALSFATKYRWWIVLAGVTAATLLVHLGSVALGRAADEVLPARVLQLVVGLSFLGFAWWTLRGDTLDEDDTAVRAAGMGAFGVVAVAFFISEIGDKTQLATVSIAGNDPSFAGVWLGSTAGMVLADALAIGLGLVAGRNLPERAIARVAAALFLIVGVVTIAAALL